MFLYDFVDINNEKIFLNICSSKLIFKNSFFPFIFYQNNFLGITKNYLGRTKFKLGKTKYLAFILEKGHF